VSGLLFAPDDAERFAAHLERYRDDPDLRRRHGAAGLQVARDHTWQHQVELLEKHYCAAMDAAVVGAVAVAA
jgi:glycosyltransferase involved in cell wall biosynthesis